MRVKSWFHFTRWMESDTNQPRTKANDTPLNEVLDFVYAMQMSMNTPLRLSMLAYV